MIRLLTVACLCAASLQIAIWSGLVADWTRLVGSSLGDAATTLEPATEPRPALTSPSDPLNRDVAAADEENRKLEEAWRQNSAAEQQLLAQEGARAEALDRLAAARQEIQTLKMRQIDGAQELAQERARAEALDRGLAAARQEIQTLKVDQANAAQDASAADRTPARERARGEVLAGNLAAVREENRTTVRAEAVADNTSVPQPEFPRNENDESALHNSNDPGPTSHAMAAAVPSANTLAAMQQSDTPSEAEAVPAAATPSRSADEERSLARAAAPVRQSNIQGARLWLEHSVESGSARAAFALAETYDAHMIPGDAIHHLDPNEIVSSLRRGDALIASGDLAAARLVLRRAADAGDARAAMTLAETYDPAILEKLGVHGVVPDLAMARGWYEKAKKLGATEATQRLELLASKQH
jgi:TPR repeat protein